MLGVILGALAMMIGVPFVVLIWYVVMSMFD